MPLWGVAYALGPNINLDVDPEHEKAAYEAVKKAVALSAGAPENERVFPSFDEPAFKSLRQLERRAAHNLRAVFRRGA